MKYPFLIAAVLWLGTLPAFADYVATSGRVESFVNVRKTPEANGEIVGRLATGERLEFVRTVDGWHEIAMPDGTTGFVHGDWAVIVADADPVGSVDGEPDPTEARGAEPESEPEGPAPAEEGDADDVPVSAEPAPTAVDPAEPVETAEEAVEAAEVPAEISPDAEQVPEAESAEAADEPVPELRDPVEPQPAATVPPAPPADAPPASTVPLKMRGPDNYLVRFHGDSQGRASQVYDDGNFVGIGTTSPQQRLEVNGSIRINEENSAVAGLMITQDGGETGYMLHNRASTLTIGAGSVDRLTIDRDGNVGIGEARPTHPLQMASGAHVTRGGVWTNASSRSVKEDIAELSAGEAIHALEGLEPVSFRYVGTDPETYLGFIAEDVPELVAMSGREGLSSMDLVAVLTRVVQSQQERIDTLEGRLETLEMRERQVPATDPRH
jgi:Bacterial SH3 domain/Chaperone of endosialidase